ncbi:MAG: ABC transporter ATP-binding protein [Actinobacteria bacterium]|uniref:ABC transporter ATP-binding protein n=1 Tax=Microbacterium sp. NPDC076895 TaxID=3154957 RepID=UPI0010032830|nr:MAG: ABC transporter ATP-binding protein [Actinomycetota bacterium]
MTSVLEFDSVRAFYEDALIIDGVSLTVDEGECLALLGPNGVGKTTTLNSIYSIAHVRGGSIAVGGRRLRTRKAHEPTRLGASLVPQGRWIIPNLSVEENLILGSASGRRGHWNLARVYEMFPDLKGRRASPGTALSGGQQQMLAIGRALMANPLVLLLDEPSEGLAPVIIDRLGDALSQLREEGTSMLLVEQRLDLVLRLSDRFAVMSKGTIVSTGRTSDVGPAELKDYVALV